MRSTRFPLSVLAVCFPLADSSVADYHNPSVCLDLSPAGYGPTASGL